MMSFDQWLTYLLRRVENVASRDHQQKTWFGPRDEINWVGDIYNDLDESTFDLFYTLYSKNFSAEQVTAWNDFKQAFGNYGEKLPNYPEPQSVFDDPEWQLVREAAGRFVTAFEQEQLNSSPTRHR